MIRIIFLPQHVMRKELQWLMVSVVPSSLHSAPLWLKQNYTYCFILSYVRDGAVMQAVSSSGFGLTCAESLDQCCILNRCPALHFAKRSEVKEMCEGARVQVLCPSF